MMKPAPDPSAKRRPPKREAISLGRWFPIARRIRQRCCRCGLAHTVKFRVRVRELEMMVLP